MVGWIVALALAGAPACASENAHANVAGRVTLGGIRPSGDAVWISKGGQCPQFITDDRIVAQADGSLRDVVVMLLPLSGDPRGLAPAAPAEAAIQARLCGLEPRVQVARPGSLLVVTTEARAIHLLHAYRDGNTQWEELRDGRRPQLLQKSGAVDIRCDTTHEWELAWVYVTDAPWVAVTDGSGHFDLPEVPPGAYRLRAWHPYLGTIEVPIEVEPQRASGLVVASLSEIDPTKMLSDLMPTDDAAKISSEVVDVKIRTDDGTEIAADVVLRDRDLDLAFIRPKKAPETPMKFVDLSQAAAPQVADGLVLLSRVRAGGPARGVASGRENN